MYNITTDYNQVQPYFIKLSYNDSIRKTDNISRPSIPIMSSSEEDPSSDVPKYEFTSQEKPQRVARIELELVNFKINLTLQDGSCFSISNPVHVQTILNQAKGFNRIISDNANSNDADPTFTGNTKTEKIVKDRVNDNLVVIEIQLDPLNSVNTYHISA